MDDRWLSVQEIARHLGVSRDTVYTWLGKQIMPAHRVGRLWKFRRSEVDAWVLEGGAAALSSAQASDERTGADEPSRSNDSQGRLSKP